MSDIVVKSDRRNAKIYAKLRGIEAATKRAIRHAWFESGDDMMAEANRQALARPKRGRVYLVRLSGGRTRRHRASAPGESHANMRGTLRKSLSWKVHGWESMDFGYGVSVTARNPAPRYASFVEFGTSRMAERPTLNNAIAATQRSVEQHFSEAMDREFAR